MGFSGNRAAAEVAHAAAMLMAAAAWRGGGSSGCGARPEVASSVGEEEAMTTRKDVAGLGGGSR